MSAFSFIPINDLIRGLPPGALSSRTANNENIFFTRKLSYDSGLQEVLNQH